MTFFSNRKLSKTVTFSIDRLDTPSLGTRKRQVSPDITIKDCISLELSSFNSPQREKVNNLIEGKASSLRDEFSTEITFCFLTRHKDEYTAVGIEMSHSDGRV